MPVGRFAACVILTLVGILSCTPSLAAPSGAAPLSADHPDSARNSADFNFVVRTIMENDAGVPTRVTEANRDSLERLTSRLRARTATADELELEILLREWLRFFRAGHLEVGRMAQGTPFGYVTRVPGTAGSEPKPVAVPPAAGAESWQSSGTGGIRSRAFGRRTAGHTALRFSAPVAPRPKTSFSEWSWPAVKGAGPQARSRRSSRAFPPRWRRAHTGCGTIRPGRSSRA